MPKQHLQRHSILGISIPLSSRNIVVSSPSNTSINTGIYKVLKVAIMSLSAKEQVLVNEMMYTN